MTVARSSGIASRALCHARCSNTVHGLTCLSSRPSIWTICCACHSYVDQPPSAAQPHEQIAHRTGLVELKLRCGQPDPARLPAALVSHQPGNRRFDPPAPFQQLLAEQNIRPALQPQASRPNERPCPSARIARRSRSGRVVPRLLTRAAQARRGRRWFVPRCRRPFSSARSTLEPT